VHEKRREKRVGKKRRVTNSHAGKILPILNGGDGKKMGNGIDLG